jgi:subtilisin family serine protease
MKISKKFAFLAALAAVSAGGLISAAAVEAKTTEFRAGEIIVKYREAVTEKEKDDLHRRHGSKRLKRLERFRMDHLQVRAGQTVDEAVREMAQDPAVEYAEPNYVYHSQAVPGDPQFASLWGMAKIMAPAAWDTTTGSSEVVVAVIDSGLDYSHPDLQQNMWVNQAELVGRPGVDDDGDGYVDDVHGYNAIAGNGTLTDDVGHGTHVSGTIGAAGNNGLGVAGVNWNVKIVGCKFMDATGAGSTDGALACLQYVRTLKDRGVNIVATNNSWGGGGYSQALYDAIRQQGDILFVAAAGNDSANNDATPTYPACYNLPNMISVGATTASDSRALFSNYGRRTVDVAAPGENILSTYPGGLYKSFSGTSMATPHVTGLAALLKAKDPTLDWRGIRNLILSSGDPDGAITGSTVTGRRINAFNAVTCLDSRAFAALKYPSAPQPGVPATLAALSVNCAAPTGPVTVALSAGEVILLKDDGLAPDEVAGDGIFTGTFVPVRAAETFTFSSPAGSETIAVP